MISIQGQGSKAQADQQIPQTHIPIGIRPLYKIALNR